jgi:uncharacterized protein YndB with AHSA1/START domain
MNAETKTDAKSIRVEYELPQPPPRVWRALTEPELLGKWLMVNDIRAVVGHRFTFKAPPMPGWDGTVHCEVLEVVPEKLVRYSWRGGAENALLDSVVTWTLSSTASGGTRLSLLHAGFLPVNAFAYEAMSKGWRATGKLAERLAQALQEAG